jgi:hypothetical protein
LDTDENSEFRDQGDNVLPASGDGDGYESVHMTLNFCGRIWTITMDRQCFTGICGPQNSAQGVTIIDIFELLFDMDLNHKTVNETNRYAQQFKNS